MSKIDNLVRKQMPDVVFGLVKEYHENLKENDFILLDKQMR
jgi:hypothetical protein